MTAWILAFFLALASVILPHAQALAETGGQARFHPLIVTGTGSVRAVIDPLTLQLEDGRIVRLAGLDIPDLNPHEPGTLSVSALEALKQEFEGREVNLYQTPDSETGRVNRMKQEIAHLERTGDRLWAQGLLLSRGLARVRTTRSTPEMAQAMYELERAAREGRKGLWAEGGHPVLNPVQAQRRIGSFQVVEGRVEGVAMVNNRTFVNFGADWRTDFTVSMDAAALRLFAAKGEDPQQWGGRTIRVRGWLESYNGPSIRIDHAQCVEFPDSGTPAQAANDSSSLQPASAPNMLEPAATR